MSTIAERLRPSTSRSRTVGLTGAAVIWVTLYRLNQPFWDWLLFDVAGLDPASPLGSGLHFFF